MTAGEGDDVERRNQESRREPKGPVSNLWVRAAVLLGLTLVLTALPGCKLPGAIQRQFARQVRPVSDTDRLLRNAAYLKQSGRVELAVKELEEAHAKEPQNLEILDTLIQCYEVLGDFDRAQELYAEAEARGLSHPALENNRCYSWFLAGRFEQAEACFRKLLARQPDNQTARNNLGLVLCRTGREAEALELWRQSLDEAGARQRLEQALAALGRGAPPALAQKPAPTGAPTPVPPSLPLPSPAAAPDPKASGSPVKAAAPRPAPAFPTAAAPTAPALPGYQTKSPDNIGTTAKAGREEAPRLAPPPGSPQKEPVKDDSRPTLSPQDRPAPRATPSPAAESMGRKPERPPAAETSPPRPQAAGTYKLSPEPLADIRIELKNGNGVKNYAREWRRRLTAEGFVVVDIGNHHDFGLEATTIAYRPEAARVARELAQKFFPQARLEEGGKISPQADIRVSLGHDRLGVSGPSAAAPSPSRPSAPPEANISATSEARSEKLPPPRLAAPSEARTSAFLTLPELTDIRIEIKNGNGVKNLAREWRRRLSEEGFTVVDIGNHHDFGLETTTIAYRPEAARVAQNLARKFFPQAKLQEDGKVSPQADVRLSLGLDLIPQLQQVSQAQVP